MTTQEVTLTSNRESPYEAWYTDLEFGRGAWHLKGSLQGEILSMLAASAMCAPSGCDLPSGGSARLWLKAQELLAPKARRHPGMAVQHGYTQQVELRDEQV